MEYFELAKSIVEAQKTVKALEALNEEMVRSRIAKAPESLQKHICSECKQPLDTDEIQAAKQERLKHPICDDCFMDFARGPKDKSNDTDESDSPFFSDDSSQL